MECLFGMVSLADYRRAASKDPSSVEQLRVRDIATRDVITVYPDDTLGVVLRRMAPGDLSRLPVVSRDDPCRLVGVVRRNSIVQAHEMGVARRDEARRRAAETQLVSDGLAEFVDIPIPPGSDAAGKTVAELKLPSTAILVSIRRDHQLLIPHGNARLQVGDVVTALCESNSSAFLKSRLTDPPDHEKNA